MSEITLWIEEQADFVSVTGTMPIRPATPEEIKAAHPRCGSCKWHRDNMFGKYCGHFRLTVLLRTLPSDYCNHHEPKET